MKKPDLKTILVSSVMIISIFSAICGFYMTYVGSSILAYSIEYGEDIGGRSMEYNDCKMNELCTPTNITFTNPEIHSESDYITQMTFYTTTLSVGYQILWAGCLQIFAGIMGGFLSFAVYERQVDIKSEVENGTNTI